MMISVPTRPPILAALEAIPATGWLGELIDYVRALEIALRGSAPHAHDDAEQPPEAAP